MHKAAYWLLQFKTFAFAPICSHKNMANLNNKQNPTPQGSWWLYSHWFEQALGVAQCKCNWLNLANSITNTIIEFIFFSLQICHLNATPGSAFIPWFCERTKPMTQLLSPQLGLLLPQPRLPTSSLPWRGEEPSLELGQDIKTFFVISLILFCSINLLF